MKKYFSVVELMFDDKFPIDYYEDSFRSSLVEIPEKCEFSIGDRIFPTEELLIKFQKACIKYINTNRYWWYKATDIISVDDLLEASKDFTNYKFAEIFFTSDDSDDLIFPIPHSEDESLRKREIELYEEYKEKFSGTMFSTELQEKAVDYVFPGMIGYLNFRITDKIYDFKNDETIYSISLVGRKDCP